MDPQSKLASKSSHMGELWVRLRPCFSKLEEQREIMPGIYLGPPHLHVCIPTHVKPACTHMCTYTHTCTCKRVNTIHMKMEKEKSFCRR